MSSALDHVLVLAPYRKDSTYLGRLLGEHDIQVDVSSSSEDLPERLAASPGVLMTTHEALTPAVTDAVARHLSAQPAWSEMPIIVLLDRASPQAQIRAELSWKWPRARQLFYERPVTAVELVSGVQSALQVRFRQRDVRDHIAREIELRRELNHRVKNILASVTSIFEMTWRGASSLEEVAQDFRGRLGALAAIHSAVFHAAGETVAMADIVDLTFQPYHSAGGDRIRTDGPPVILTRDAGTTLALCLHELATNAIKYGALTSPKGRVQFEWRVSDGEQREFSIHWQESDGPAVRKPEHAGYGTRYVASALTSLFGVRPLLAFNAEGFLCEAAGRSVSCGSNFVTIASIRVPHSNSPRIPP